MWLRLITYSFAWRVVTHLRPTLWPLVDLTLSVSPPQSVFLKHAYFCFLLASDVLLSIPSPTTPAFIPTPARSMATSVHMASLYLTSRVSLC